MTRQCSSCGGFCKKSGCERENVSTGNELDNLRTQLAAAQAENMKLREAAAHAENIKLREAVEYVRVDRRFTSLSDDTVFRVQVVLSTLPGDRTALREICLRVAMTIWRCPNWSLLGEPDVEAIVDEVLK